jgi:membrane protease YdiL (CAAX protease family)
MFSRNRRWRHRSGFGDWTNGGWDDRWFGGRGPFSRGGPFGYGGPFSGTQPFGATGAGPFGWRRGRALGGIIAALLAAFVAERLFFRGPFRRRSGLGRLLSALAVIAIGAAAVSAWRRRRQPFNF